MKVLFFIHFLNDFSLLKTDSTEKLICDGLIINDV